MNLLFLGIVCLVIALIAGFFGFYNIQHAAVGLAKIFFFLFVTLFVLILVYQFFYGRL